MAEINAGGSGGNKKGKPKKINLRVDFTPMVDMNMLLLTFFMFCTSLSRPQIMELVLPTKDIKELTPEEKTKVKESKAITLILGPENKVYYYFGKITDEMYANPNSLKQTDYSPLGLRAILLDRNADVVREITELKHKKLRKEITEAEFKEQSAKIKDDPEGQMVIIKPTDYSSYRNMIDALDEMQITSIGKYALVEMTEGDTYLLTNYLTAGAGSVR